MKVVGVSLVRNEVDVIETNLRHHLETVLDEVIVMDNGSTDGTLELLADLADELPLRLGSEVGHMYQSGRVTRMARFAVQLGADWVLPFDADEFWVAADTPFRSVLDAAPVDARALFVEVINFVQQRDVLAVQPGVLHTMTMRPPRTVGTAEDASRLGRTGEVGWFELAYTPKCVHRATRDIVVATGNHLTGISSGVATGALACLHAPVRARSVLVQKIDQGRRLVEEHSPADAGWHVKRWWQMARAGTLDQEWEALSYRDGAITVSGTRHELVPDDRLRVAVDAVTPHVGMNVAQVFNPLDELDPAVAAYLLALDTVPGSFSILDGRVLVALDQMQREQGVSGDLFEIGTAYGKSAILLGYLPRPPAERLTVCDVFEHKESIDAESMAIVNHWDADVTEQAFLLQYERFHEVPPNVIVGPSGDIDVGERAGTCRIVHLDGGHGYDNVGQDMATARTILQPGGLVAFSRMATPDSPGVALAVWQLVLGGAFTPLCLTPYALYGTWDTDAGVAGWAGAIDAWVAGQADLGSDLHTLAGWPVRRLFTMGRPPVQADRLVRIPDLQEMQGPLDPVAKIDPGAEAGAGAVVTPDP